MSTPAPSTVPSAGSFPRPVRALGTAVAVLLVVTAAVRAIAVTVEGWVRYDVMSQVYSGGNVGYAGAIGSIKAALLGAHGSMVLVLVTGVVFLVWLARARTNAALLSPGPFRLGAGWAVGAWFVPLANLVLPAVVVADTWRASSRGTRSAGLVAGWWTALAGSWVIDWAAQITATGGRDTAAYASAFLLLVLEALLTVVAGILAAQIVRRISGWQQPTAHEPA